MDKLRIYNKVLLYACGGISILYFIYKIFQNRKAKRLSQESILPLRKGEAKHRSELIRNLKYTLFLQLNTNQDPVIIKSKPHKNVFQGCVLIEFDLERIEDIFLDFKGNVINIEINSEKIKKFEHMNGRIYVPAESLSKHNRIQITYANQYSHDSEGLRYFVDSNDESPYVYSQFEPFFAHTTFPCFDQPSLKASIRLIVSAPSDWIVISSSEKKEEVKAGSQLWNDKIQQIKTEIIEIPDITRDFTIHEFNSTPNIPTYSFAVCAGPFELALEKDTFTPPINIYCRKTMLNSFDGFSIRTTGRMALDWFKENLTNNIPYKKFDFVFVPELKIVAMENVGCITFDDKFIEPNRTSVENTYFHSIIVHELVHTWFGNYVTPEWWDDLWLNESFATFLSYLCLQQIAEVDNNYMSEYKVMWLQFAKSKTETIKRDQYSNTHKIRDICEDTSHAETIFDKITYYKGASILKYFYYCIGHELFFKGLKNYVNYHPNTVANYEAFKKCLKSVSETKNIKAPLEIIEPFLDNKGVVRLDTEIKYNNNLIEKFKVTQVPCNKSTENLYYNFITDILVIYPGKEVILYGVNIPGKEESVINELEKIPAQKRIDNRIEKFGKMGFWEEKEIVK